MKNRTYAFDFDGTLTNYDGNFKGHDVVDEPRLEVIKAIQTIAGNSDPRFEDWFDALDYMKEEINEKDFDIAIIGCGAYGLPLAAYIKSIGKQAIHLAGKTQLLFGIKGKRWNNNPDINYTKHWISPLPEDIPDNHTKIEDGCYW